VTKVELELQGDVAVLWFDRPERGPNLLDRGALDALPAALERLERDEAIRGVVLASRKADGFIAGADIALFDELADRGAVLELVRLAQGLVERLAALPKPTVAAIDGACAGGGLELALACNRRLASTSPRTSLALPEVRLGLLPALGGTQRLPRLIGLRAALDMLLAGRKVYARSALKLGLVDATVHPEGLLAAALRAARRPPAATHGATASGHAGFRRQRQLVERLLDRRPVRELIFRRTAEQARRQTRGNYPAPERILELVRRTLGGDLAAGLGAEAEEFAELLFTPESRALRHLFFVRAASRRNLWAGSALPVERVAVLGAGLMGSGIAQVSADPGGLGVLLKDRSLELAASGKAAAYRGLSSRLGKGMTPFGRDLAAQRLRTVREYSELGGVDLTIEAVLEDLELKRAVLREVEAVTASDHVFASNTSSLPISEIAAGAARPDRVVGMHYFSPVPRMPLLEVVRGPATSEEALATAVATGLRQGKSVIVVNDSPGFYVNRILAPYLNEALLLVREGAAIDEIDRAMEQAGFPVGPFRLLDNVGLDVVAKVVDVLAPLFAERGLALEHSAGRLAQAGLAGRKSGRGFYLYPTRGLRRVNDEAYRLIGTGSRRPTADEEVAERLLLALVNEAVRCLDEGIIASEEDGDAGAVFGLGFPPFLGGPFHYLAGRGPDRLVERLRALRARNGERFLPAAGLLHGR
jgi:3-hydroxyacyl-CoA dehydrogenase/enoyl-CoA hydratase/3-hydroxybutyryl-CoA epimerase